MYLLDIDPGQPIFSMAGALSLLHIPSLILTNADYDKAIPLKTYFLNNSSPGANMTYYLSCIASLLKHYKALTNSINKTLIINTCGWVEGLGANLLIEATKLIKPNIVVTMMKHS